MRKLLTAAPCAAPLALASCSTLPTPSTDQTAQIDTAIDRAQAAYDRIAVSANLVLPFLSPERHARRLAQIDIAALDKLTKTSAQVVQPMTVTPIVSDFVIAPSIVPGYSKQPASAAPDVVGAFRFICTP